ncbi:MAG: L-serine ammonia-lyase [Saprospiraceae bacterium]
MERISVFDIFKIGIGPSSSHTMGPWKAAQRFIQALEDKGHLNQTLQVKTYLYGSLAKTGVGHGTDTAILLGLSGFDPVDIPEESIPGIVLDIQTNHKIKLKGTKLIPFNTTTDLIFLKDQSLPFHPNGLTFEAWLDEEQIVKATYFSIGGGFVIEENEEAGLTSVQLPYPVQSSKELEDYCETTTKAIHEIVWQNELQWKSEVQINKGLLNIFEAMLTCAYKGCHSEGYLPGGLNVSRRAYIINKKLLGATSTYRNEKEWIQAIRSSNQNFESINKWISCFALAVNEVNASFGRVVTAPTNGAAGVIPAVLLYIYCFNPDVKDDDIIQFLLTAGEIGSIFKKGSTISAAMGGCQAEIGVSSAMAAAGLASFLGGSYKQVLMAAEIAMEHHLGMTCDPIGGLVQIPCIERNTMGAVKAITAAHIAMESNPNDAKVSLDTVIKTMWETAQDMNHKYKETAEGGLALNISVNLPEC